MTRCSLPVLAAVLACWLALAAAPGARAQTAPVEPYYAVTIRPDVPLKSGDMDGYYHVALLPEGQVLRVDAEGAGWARVAYPPGLTVFVSAGEVRLEEGGQVAVLTKVSALKSRNASAGFAQSWQRAVPRGSELSPGARLRVVEPVEGPAGPVGFVVQPPEEVRGYVKADALRVATDEEVTEYLASLPAPAPEFERQPEPTPPADQQPPQEQPAPQDQPPQQPAEEPEEIDLTAPMPEGETPAQPQEQAEQPAQPEDGVTVVEQGGATPAEREVGTLQRLAEAFEEVQRQPSESAELDELAAEFRRAIAAQGDDPAGQRLRQGLESRLQLVELRIAARDRLRDLAARRQAIDASSQALAGRVRELERSRGYQFVGRLVRSSVYDGSRLPLMYRIVSVNESTPRTIGYMRPGAAGLDIESKLGEIVGVLGTSQLDEALQLRIVSPTRVDVLQPERLGMPEPASATVPDPGD